MSGIEKRGWDCLFLMASPFTVQAESPAHDNLYKLLNLHHENLQCILDVPSRWI